MILPHLPPPEPSLTAAYGRLPGGVRALRRSAPKLRRRRRSATFRPRPTLPRLAPALRLHSYDPHIPQQQLPPSATDLGAFYFRYGRWRPNRRRRGHLSSAIGPFLVPFRNPLHRPSVLFTIAARSRARILDRVLRSPQLGVPALFSYPPMAWMPMRRVGRRTGGGGYVVATGFLRFFVPHSRTVPVLLPRAARMVYLKNLSAVRSLRHLFYVLARLNGLANGLIRPILRGPLVNLFGLSPLPLWGRLRSLRRWLVAAGTLLSAPPTAHLLLRPSLLVTGNGLASPRRRILVHRRTLLARPSRPTLRGYFPLPTSSFRFRLRRMPRPPRRFRRVAVRLVRLFPQRLRRPAWRRAVST